MNIEQQINRRKREFQIILWLFKNDLTILNYIYKKEV